MHTNQGTRSTAAMVISKVPQVTMWFWIIKIMATTVGETAADFLASNLHLGLTLTTGIMVALLAVALAFQIRAPRYVPALYWLAVVLVSIVGTQVTDNLVDHVGVSLELTTALFSVCLAASFTAWYRREGTLSIHSIHTRRREGFYWATILFTFALGTAAGDLIAERMSLGYWRSAILFGSMIGLVVLVWRFLGLNAILAFWAAYVLTRPLGASLGDFLSQPRDEGGLGLGTVGTSAMFLVTILACVVYLTRSRRDEDLIPASA